MLEKDALAGIVGSANITDDPAVLKGYRVDMSFVQPVPPMLVVRPGDGNEVQRVVGWANETGTPLVTMSSGPPHFRGDTVPSAGGAVLVDLSRMKQIIKVDRRNRMAMVEPGVTFNELRPVLEKKGLRLNMPLLPRDTKSVIGSMLEREPVLMPKYHWDASDPLGCTEVVFGTGEMMMTGEAGGLGPLEDQWKAKLAQKNPLGPAQLDFFRLIQGAQGTIGIVTWATIKCELLPRERKLFFVTSERLEQLADFAYRLLRSRYGDEFFLLNCANMAYMLGKTTKEVKTLKESLPSWILVLGVGGYGLLPQERVEFQSKDIEDIAQQFGLSPVSAIRGVRDLEVQGLLNSPFGDPWKLRYKGGCHDIFFVTTLDQAAGFVKAMYRLAAGSGYSSSDVGVYLQPQVQGVSCHCEFNLPFALENESELEKVRDLFTTASEELMNMGGFFSRPYGHWADMAYRRDAETTIALRKVKQIFDPNNILNPGKICF